MDRHDLNPDAQRVVDLAREARTPRAADKRRVRRAVAVGLGALAVSATTGVATPAAAIGAGLFATLRVVATVALVTTAGAGSLWWAHAHKPVPPQAASASSTRMAPPVTARALTPPSDDPLVAELALLRDAQRSLRDGHAARALELAQRHATLYPRSQLRLEGEGLEIFALCALGRPSDAHRLAAELLARAPRSPLRASLEESCALPPALPAPRL